MLEPKVKVSRGKRQLAVTELAPGDAVVCVAEIELDEQNQPTKYIAFDIKIDRQARPAVY